MVKSGLDHDRFKEDNSVPRVSQYRLAAHLAAAVALFTALFNMSVVRILLPLMVIVSGQIAERSRCCALLKSFLAQPLPVATTSHMNLVRFRRLAHGTTVGVVGQSACISVLRRIHLISIILGLGIGYTYVW